VIHYLGHRGGVNLAGHERLVGREGLVDAEVETVVAFLAEMQAENDSAPCYEHGYDYNGRSGAQQMKSAF
jgi:hypothetical protein